MFQSTLPHGERLVIGLVRAKDIGFNPRSHMGSDALVLAAAAVLAAVSIHAPTWGAT